MIDRLRIPENAVWTLSNRCDPAAREIADRHYNRQKKGARGFVPPGRCVVLLSSDSTALFVASWPLKQYVKHEWAGAWVNSTFRNEGQNLSSFLIREAISVVRWYWSIVPDMGMITFVDPSKVKKKRDFGRCYIKAGFSVEEKKTKGGLIALSIKQENMPEPKAPIGFRPIP